MTLNPASIGDWFNRGVALHQLGRHDEAIASYHRVLALESDFPNAHFNRGNVLAHVNRDAEALASYDRMLALDPRHVEALVNRGNVLLKLGRPAEALAGLRGGLRSRPRPCGGPGQSRHGAEPASRGSPRLRRAIGRR